MVIEQETIAAVATAPGRGGIGVVRVSGERARACLAEVLGRGEWEGRRATFARVLDDGVVIDVAVVTYFPGPSSYTGEDVVEVATHGSPVVLDHVLGAALAGGARVARPGEFTERAFLNGRLDLTQAEAVRDLVEASTLHQARVAAEQLGGALSGRVAPLKEALVGLVAAIEAGIDFAEDDIDVIGNDVVMGRVEAVAGPLRDLEATYAYGRVVRDGLTLAIVGAPNVGKSSLFNRLVDRERAIVTATPGTTRDVVAERVAIGGVPVELLDTAGLRATEDEAEAMGITRTREAMAGADVVLLVGDGSGDPSGGGEGELERSLEGRTWVRVWNKSDLVVDREKRGGGVWTSAVTGEGIGELRAAIEACLRRGSVREGGMLTNQRQHDAVKRALATLGAAGEAVARGLPHEVVMVDLYGALGALDELTGTTTPEDVLRVIFSTFCIGK